MNLAKIVAKVAYPFFEVGDKVLNISFGYEGTVYSKQLSKLGWWIVSMQGDHGATGGPANDFKKISDNDISKST